VTPRGGTGSNNSRNYGSNPYGNSRSYGQPHGYSVPQGGYNGGGYNAPHKAATALHVAASVEMAAALVETMAAAPRAVPIAHLTAAADLMVAAAAAAGIRAVEGTAATTRNHCVADLALHGPERSGPWRVRTRT